MLLHTNLPLLTLLTGISLFNICTAQNSYFWQAITFIQVKMQFFKFYFKHISLRRLRKNKKKISTRWTKCCYYKAFVAKDTPRKFYKAWWNLQNTMLELTIKPVDRLTTLTFNYLLHRHLQRWKTFTVMLVERSLFFV